MTTGTISRPAGRATAAALTRYRALAYATGVFLLLLTLHVIVQLIQHAGSSGGRVFDEPGLGRWLPHGEVWIPVTHGWLYLIYVLVAVDLWFRTRLPVVRMALVVLAGTVPAMSFVAERWVTGRVRPTLVGGVTAGQ